MMDLEPHLLKNTLELAKPEVEVITVFVFAGESGMLVREAKVIHKCVGVETWYNSQGCPNGFAHITVVDTWGGAKPKGQKQENTKLARDWVAKTKAPTAGPMDRPVQKTVLEVEACHELIRF